VAAEVAFDALHKRYRTSEIVLLQYHQHIPGPDPMTNNDTEARAKYYDARATPSTFFNGIPNAAGGGPMAAAHEKYQAYCDILDPLLEKPATCKLVAVAKRLDDKIQIAAEVKDLQKITANLKLRLVLVEEKVRFVGSNKIRFHHQVVRAMPGGPDGKLITGNNFKTIETVDLAHLRNSLTAYLDDFAAKKRPFPQPDRPLDLLNLAVIGMVQDDTTHEILQAVQVAVAN
jgi:hypothetical protein